MAHLQEENFTLGLWYAEQRQAALGLNLEDIPLDERYLVELGNGYIGGATLLLEQAVWNASETDANFSHFHIEEHTTDSYLIMDIRRGKQDILLKNLVLNSRFDLLAWYRTSFAEQASETDYDLLTMSDSEIAEISPEDYSDMPGLQSVSDSESEGDDEMELPYPVDASETWDDRIASMAHIFNKLNLTQTEKPARAHRFAVPAAHNILESWPPTFE
ncbi:hypothetical protein B0H10DRAFT_1952376 [Mycena sp. CBHHK59/15]|nr:hypothetical protein B0H10DRAFT_1952376 [Mycena sp. CBHHK59/15]